MSTNERFGESITGWLEQTAPARLPDRVLEATFERTRGSRQQVGWRAGFGRMHVARSVAALGGAAAVVTVATALAVGSFVVVGGPSPSPVTQSPFEGTWFSTSDTDGGTQTMTVRAAAEGGIEIVVTDDVASVCSLSPSTMTGTGRIEGATKLVIPAPVYTCDDGSEPQALSGPPLEDQLRNLTFVRDAQAANLTDNFGGVWLREVATAPSTGSSASPSAAGTVEFPDLTETFVSPINGYVFKYTLRRGPVPATERWDPDNQPPIARDELYAGGAPYQDQFDVLETGFGAAFFSASTEIPDGVAIDGWVDASVVKYLAGDCHVPRSQQAAITIDGQSGRISECSGVPGEVVATVVVDGRLYLFLMVHDRPDARAVFDAFAATIRLTPETPWYFANLTTPFVSSINGYAFKYTDRGGLEPATERWDPDNQPPIASDDFQVWESQFDVVETGFGAAFFSASTEIPEGVAIEEWIDASVAKYLAGDCHGPRSQAAAIAIDGQSGRISECSGNPGEVAATVVVDGRLYLFILYHQRPDARAFFDSWVDTIELTPETAAASAPIDAVSASSPSVAP